MGGASERVQSAWSPLLLRCLVDPRRISGRMKLSGMILVRLTSCIPVIVEFLWLNECSL